MTDTSTALHALGITEWFFVEPTSEDQFNQMFRKVTGKNANGTAIERDILSKVTWSEVSSKKRACKCRTDEVIA